MTPHKEFFQKLSRIPFQKQYEDSFSCSIYQFKPCLKLRNKTVQRKKKKKDLHEQF